MRERRLRDELMGKIDKVLTKFARLLSSNVEFKGWLSLCKLPQCYADNHADPPIGLGTLSVEGTI